MHLKKLIAPAAAFATALTFATAAPAQAPAPAAKASCDNPKPPPKELVKKDLEVGTGRDVKFRTAVLVHYTGWFYDGCKADFKGEVFDTSSGRSMPFGFMVGANRVIKGWDEGIIGMKEQGSKRLLIVPPDKAYGPGSGKIPPNATLVFEVTMVQFIHYPAEGEATK